MDIRRFNTICLVLCVFFIGSTLIEWRTALANFDASQNTIDPIASEDPYAVLAQKDDLAPVSFTTNSVEDVVDSREEDAPEPVAEGQGGEEADLDLVLPATVTLEVPFTSQAPEHNWDQPWQDACEEASVLMLDAYYKGYGLSPLFAKDEILRMVSWQEDRGWGGSIPSRDIVSLIEHVTGRESAKEIFNPTATDIKTAIASGHPVLVVADGRELPNPHFSGEGPAYHALIVRGYTPTHFITNDPGTRHGENFEYTYDGLLSSIRDWNNGDVPNGQRVVIVME